MPAKPDPKRSREAGSGTVRSTKPALVMTDCPMFPPGEHWEPEAVVTSQPYPKMNEPLTAVVSMWTPVLFSPVGSAKAYKVKLVATKPWARSAAAKFPKFRDPPDANPSASNTSLDPAPVVAL